MSRLLASLLFATTLLTSTMALAAPDNNPANMPAGQYTLEKTHASINAKVMHHGYAFYHFRLHNFLYILNINSNQARKASYIDFSTKTNKSLICDSYLCLNFRYIKLQRVSSSGADCWPFIMQLPIQTM